LLRPDFGAGQDLPLRPRPSSPAYLNTYYDSKIYLANSMTYMVFLNGCRGLICATVQAVKELFMHKVTLLIALLTLMAVCGSVAWSAGPPHTKLLPYSIYYPLISPVPFASPARDPYRAHFNVRRMLQTVIEKDFDATFRETAKWFDLYSGYGVLGHGEDVFTDRAAAYRRSHRGR